jgi:hypothetical protein
MSNTRSYDNVTEAIFGCIKATSKREHGTTYDPPNGDSGTATTDTFVGKVVLGFDLSSGKLTYTIKEKPGIVTEDEIWNGTDDTVSGCRNS